MVENSIGYQRAVQRALAEMRANGSWKAKMVDDIYTTMAEGEGKKRLHDMMIGARKEADAMRLAEDRRQFDSRYSLARDKMKMNERDNRWATVASLGNLLASGYTGYQDMKDQRQEAALTRKSQENILEELRRLRGGSNV